MDLHALAMVVGCVGIHQFVSSGLSEDSLIAQPQELDVILGSWRRVVQRQRLFPVGVATLFSLLISL